MTAEKLHDALNLLPSDLITQTDRLRSAPKTTSLPWKRILPVAACFVLLLGLGIMIRQEMLPGPMMKQETAAQAPAAMAPAAPESQKATADGVFPEPPSDPAAPEMPAEEELPSDIGAPEVPYGETAGSVNGMEEELCIDHSHRFAEETEIAGSTGAYCGNTVTTVYLDGGIYSFGGSDSVALTHMLRNLPYDPAAVCRCMAEFTVDTEFLAGIEVNLTEAFARCEKGQAALTEAQTQTLREIIEKLR